MARNALSTFGSDGGWGMSPFVLLHREMNRLFDEVARGGPAAQAPAAGEALIPQRDMYGCQQHAPLMDLPVSLKTVRPASQK